jgi:hypothetical protein
LVHARYAVIRHGEQRDRVLAGVKLRLGERVLVRAKAAGDRETHVAGDDRAVHQDSHFPVGDLRKEPRAKGVSKVDVVQAIGRNDHVAEGQRALVRVGHVDDCAP